MVQKRPISDLTRFLRRTRQAHILAFGRSLIRVVQRAEFLAKHNVKKNFKGRNNYVLSGRLLNSIYTSFDFDSRKITSGVKNFSDLPKAFVGSRGLPYAAIHEFGGQIEPKKAKYLWLPTRNLSSLKKMTPTQFIKAMNEAKGKSRTQRTGSQTPRSKAPTFSLITAKNGKLKIAAKVTPNSGGKDKIEAVFFLVKKVKMPSRPFLRPAAKESAEGMAGHLDKEIKIAIKSLKGRK